MKVIKPGLKHYVNMINDGVPFSFVRYGEGEIKWMILSLPTKKGYPSFKPKHVREELVETVVQCHNDPAYIPAIQHRWHFKEIGKLQVVEEWFRAYAPRRSWHYAGVFRDATMKSRFHPMIKAIQNSALPVVIVGPKRIAPIVRSLTSAKHRHIITHLRFAYETVDDIQEKILKIGEPSLISFSVSFAAKVLIHRLFPVIGKHTTMIDFGSLWDGYCGYKKRPYHPKMTQALIRRNMQP